MLIGAGQFRELNGRIARYKMGDGILAGLDGHDATRISRDKMQIRLILHRHTRKVAPCEHASSKGNQLSNNHNLRTRLLFTSLSQICKLHHLNNTYVFDAFNATKKMSDFGAQREAPELSISSF